MEIKKEIFGVSYYKYSEDEAPRALWNGMPDDNNVWCPDWDVPDGPETPFVCDCGNTGFKLWLSGSYQLAGTCTSCGKSSQVYSG